MDDNGVEDINEGPSIYLMSYWFMIYLIAYWFIMCTGFLLDS
jgi:hypothetical protein